MDGYESVEIRSLERHSTELKNIKAWDISEHSHLTVWIIIIVIISIMVVLLLVVVIYRKRLARFIMSSQSEGMVRWSRTPAIHVSEDSYQDQIQELRGMILKMATVIEANKKEDKNEVSKDVASPSKLDSASNHSLISLH